MASLAFERALQEVGRGPDFALSVTTSPSSVMRNLTFLFVFCLVGLDLAATPADSAAFEGSCWIHSKY